MKSMILVILSLVVFAVVGYAQAPAVAPVVAPAVVAPSGIAGWIQSQGGFVAAVGVALGLINLLLSFAAQIFSKLALSEPSWLQSAGSILLTITQWLSANTPTKVASAEVILPKS